jgi:hypothetical protein
VTKERATCPHLQKELSQRLSTRDGFKLVFESNKWALSKYGNFVGKGYNSGGFFHPSLSDECNKFMNHVSDPGPRDCVHSVV